MNAGVENENSEDLDRTEDDDQGEDAEPMQSDGATDTEIHPQDEEEEEEAPL